MAKATKEKLFYKKEAKRTRKEKLCRDVACYGVTIFAAIMGFLLIDANASLAEAEANAAGTGIVIAQHLN
jgi:hypothetical protein